MAERPKKHNLCGRNIGSRCRVLGRVGALGATRRPPCLECIMTGFRPYGLFAALCLFGAGPSTLPAFAAASSYDGVWSVLIVTEQGTCDRAYRYPVRVDNGRVVYEGEAGIDISGQ